MSKKSRRSVLGGIATLAAGSFVSVPGSASVSGLADVPGWSSYRGNAANSAYVPTDSFPEPEEVVWKHESTGDVVASEGRVFLRTEDNLQVLDAEDGSLVWSRAWHDWKGEDFNPIGHPVVNDGIVYVSGDQLTALNANDGSFMWEHEFEGVSEITEPTVAYGTVYVVADGVLYAFDAADGSQEWKQNYIVDEVRDGEEYVDLEFDFQQVPVAVADERIYALVEGGLNSDFRLEQVAVLDAHGDGKIWSDMERGASYYGPIVLDNDTVYVRHTYPGTELQSENAIREFEGLYEDLIPASTGETTVKGGSYDIRGDDWLQRPGWTFPFTSLLIAGETGIVYLTNGTTPDSIIGFDIHDGTQKWQMTNKTFEDVSISPRYIASEDTLYLQSDGRLIALRGEQDDNPSDDGDDDGSDDGSDDASEDWSDDGSDGGSDDSGSDDGSDGNTDDGSDDNGSDDDGSDDSGADGSTDDSSDDSNSGSTDDGTNDTDDGTDNSTEEPKSTDPDGSGGGISGSNNDSDDSTSSDGSGSEDDPDESTGQDGSDDGGDESNGSVEDDGDAAEGSEGTPGFTTSAGLLGGGLALEWIRRRVPTDEQE